MEIRGLILNNYYSPRFQEKIKNTSILMMLILYHLVMIHKYKLYAAIFMYTSNITCKNIKPIYRIVTNIAIFSFKENILLCF